MNTRKTSLNKKTKKVSIRRDLISKNDAKQSISDLEIRNESASQIKECIAVEVDNSNYEFIDEILNDVLNRVYNVVIEEKTQIKYTIDWFKIQFLKILSINFIQIDYDEFNLDQELSDNEPEPCIIDSLAVGAVPVIRKINHSNPQTNQSNKINASQAKISIKSIKTKTISLKNATNVQNIKNISLRSIKPTKILAKKSSKP